MNWSEDDEFLFLTMMDGWHKEDNIRKAGESLSLIVRARGNDPTTAEIRRALNYFNVPIEEMTDSDWATLTNAIYDNV